MIDSYTYTTNTPVSIWKKINPWWWIHNGVEANWEAPNENNGQPYLPDVKAQWLRDFYWFWRNPCGNFVGYVLGVEDKNYKAVGTAPVLMTTWADATPPGTGWKWAALFPPFSFGALAVGLAAIALALAVHWLFAVAAVFALLKVLGPLPFISYNGWIEFYLGWRPGSGGFGIKTVKGR